MKDMKLIPRVTVNTLVRELGGIYTAAVKSGWPLKRIPTPMLWGPPGVGKSAGAEQLAAAIETGTGKRAAVTEVRLLLFSPIDLRGIPVANRDKTLAEWLKPAVFDMDPSEECVNLLFLDELSAAPPAVQAAAYQLTLDRRIGEHRLPDNCIVIGAGNRTSDRSAAYRMPNALANRMQHYEIAVDFPSWQEWAIRNDIHPQVLGYLAFDNSRLYDEEVREDQTAFASPRSWMFVSDILNIMGERADLDVRESAKLDVCERYFEYYGRAGGSGCPFQSDQRLRGDGYGAVLPCLVQKPFRTALYGRDFPGEVFPISFQSGRPVRSDSLYGEIRGGPIGVREQRGDYGDGA